MSSIGYKIIEVILNKIPFNSITFQTILQSHTNIKMADIYSILDSQNVKISELQAMIDAQNVKLEELQSSLDLSLQRLEVTVEENKNLKSELKTIISELQS